MPSASYSPSSGAENDLLLTPKHNGPEVLDHNYTSMAGTSYTKKIETPKKPAENFKQMHNETLQELRDMNIHMRSIANSLNEIVQIIKNQYTS